MTKRDLLDILLFVGLFFGCVAFAVFIFSRNPNNDFKPNIAECRKMNDVNIIVEGRLYNINKKITGLRKSSLLLESWFREDPQPKPIYIFQAKFAYRGLPRGTRGNTNSSFAYVIREGEAPQGALGKEALLCLKGFRPRRIKAMYIAE